MPKYLMLSTLSEQGLQTLRANPERVREVNKDVEELGAKVVHQWFVLGPHDFVNIVEAPDASTIAKLSVALGARGSVHTQSYEMLEVDDLLDLLSD
ncbi:MAG TPA: GYD domain-containing protein [Gaiellaceae bacterium]|jgi:uncharacterized protein with GYD domain|nr:GYD domain-containing protein [Gaiellaceae bacterium]